MAEMAGGLEMPFFDVSERKRTKTKWLKWLAEMAGGLEMPFFVVQDLLFIHEN